MFRRFIFKWTDCITIYNNHDKNTAYNVDTDEIWIWDLKQNSTSPHGIFGKLIQGAGYNNVEQTGNDDNRGGGRNNNNNNNNDDDGLQFTI